MSQVAAAPTGAGAGGGGGGAGTALGAAALGLQAFGMMYQKRSARAAAAAQRQALEYNARISERNAKAADIRADFSQLVSEIDITRFRDAADRFNRAVGARYRASGFRANTGTPRQVMIANAARQDDEIQARRMNAAAQETALREQGVNERLRANLFRNQGALAMQTGQIRANTATLQGLQSMARQSYLMASA